MILVVGHVVTRVEAAAEAAEAGSAHCRRSRGVAGCLSHDMAVDAGDPLKLVFTERWVDMAALSAHLASPETRAFGAAIASLSEQGRSLEIYDATLLKKI